MTIDYSMGVTNQLNKPAEPHIFTHGEVLEKTSLRLYVRLHEAINANDYYSC